MAEDISMINMKRARYRYSSSTSICWKTSSSLLSASHPQRTTFLIFTNKPTPSALTGKHVSHSRDRDRTTDNIRIRRRANNNHTDNDTYNDNVGLFGVGLVSEPDQLSYLATSTQELYVAY